MFNPASPTYGTEVLAAPLADLSDADLLELQGWTTADEALYDERGESILQELERRNIPMTSWWKY